MTLKVSILGNGMQAYKAAVVIAREFHAHVQLIANLKVE